MNTESLKLITIDGPSASGKSSVSALLAEKLIWPWVSTGAFYRGLALLCLTRSLDLSEGKLNPGIVQTLVDLIKDPCWKIVMAERQTRVLIDGEDRTGEIASGQVGLMASDISQIPRVREALLQPQRDCFRPERGLVAEGRDCGTVVFPQARVKIYLTANRDVRAVRRLKQEGAKEIREQKGEGRADRFIGGAMEGIHAKREAVRQTVSKGYDDVLRRDERDLGRSIAPLKKPPGALVIDSTSLDPGAVVDRILVHMKKVSGGWE